jgi:hypothetical protein
MSEDPASGNYWYQCERCHTKQPPFDGPCRCGCWYGRYIDHPGAPQPEPPRAAVGVMIEFDQRRRMREPQ